MWPCNFEFKLLCDTGTKHPRAVDGDVCCVLREIMSVDGCALRVLLEKLNIEEVRQPLTMQRLVLL